MFYAHGAIYWCDQLNCAFNDEMMDALSYKYTAVAWSDGRHELYCMGGEL